MKIIGIAGISGAGKTYIINKIKEEFESNVSVLSMDNYYRKIQEQTKDSNGIENFDLPEAINVENLIKDIKELVNGNVIKLTIYQFNNPNKSEEITSIYPRKILIVEGLFTFHYHQINELFDYRIFVEADLELTLNRRLKRDIEERNIDSKMVYYQWENHVLPSYFKFILPYKEKSDLVFVNEDKNENSIKDLIKSLNQLILKHD